MLSYDTQGEKVVLGQIDRLWDLYKVMKFNPLSLNNCIKMHKYISIIKIQRYTFGVNVTTKLSLIRHATSATLFKPILKPHITK